MKANNFTLPSTNKKNFTLKDSIGIADTDLHPSGWVKIEEQRIFVISEGVLSMRVKK